MLNTLAVITREAIRNRGKVQRTKRTFRGVEAATTKLCRSLRVGKLLS